MTYAYQSVPNERVAKARVDGVNASYKDLCNVCSNVRGRNAEKALVFLQEASQGDRPIILFNFNKHRGHVGRVGGVKGGWPVKSAKIVRDVLVNALANAEKQGMGATKIAHIQANKQLVYGRMSAKGRRVRQDLETSFVEIVLKEIKGQEKAPAPKKADAKVESKKVEEKKVAPEPKTASAPSTHSHPHEEKKAVSASTPAGKS